jgi:hypothetical protein
MVRRDDWFWDGDTLVSWTANVQGWTITHALFEYSNKMERLRSTRRAKTPVDRSPV